MNDLQMHEVMGQALVERGLATPEAVALDRTALETRLNGGVPVEKAASTPVAEPLQPFEKESEAIDPLTASAFEGPSSPAAYQFDMPYGAERDFKQELAFREFFHSEGVPVWVAKEADRLAMHGAANPPTPAQLEQGRQHGMVQLAKLWGPERDANLAIAQREVARMAETRPEILDILINTGLGNSAWLAQTLVNLAKSKGRV